MEIKVNQYIREKVKLNKKWKDQKVWILQKN